MTVQLDMIFYEEFNLFFVKCNCTHKYNIYQISLKNVSFQFVLFLSAVIFVYFLIDLLLDTFTVRSVLRISHSSCRELLGKFCFTFIETS